MDPKIAAGFSLLGNALMPDPGRLAQAEVYRSQMLENQATARKTGLEADALANAANNLAQLQDLLSNKEASPEDILSRAVASGITNDPSQLPRFVLGGQALEALSAPGGINNDDAFSRALAGTGQVANWAATPSGFASDQARQEREAVAKDLTERYGKDLVYNASIYDTDVGAETDITVEGMRGSTEERIAAKRRQLDSLNAIRTDLTERHKIAVEHGDRAERLKIETQWKVLEDTSARLIADAKNLTDEAVAKGNVAGAAARNDATIAGNLTMNEQDNAALLEQQRMIEAGEIDQTRMKGGGVPNLTLGQMAAVQNSVAYQLNKLQPGSWKPGAKGKGGDVAGIAYDDWQNVIRVATRAFPDNQQEQVQTILSVMHWDKKKERWKVRWNKLNALGGGNEDDTGAGAGDTGTAKAPPDSSAEPAGMVTPPPGGWTEGVDRKQAPNGNVVVFDGTRWLWEATGKPVE